MADEPMGRQGRRILPAAAFGALIDAAFLGTGISFGWFTAGDLLIGAWVQAGIPLLVVPVLLMRASLIAPRVPAVDAGKPATFNDRPFYGRVAARLTAVFFAFHFGIFTLVLGMFSFRLTTGAATATTAGLGWLVLRAAVANIPSVLADASFLAADGYSRLAQRSQSVMGRPYLRMVPLHLGIFGMLALSMSEFAEYLDIAIVGVVVLITFAASLWRYPVLEPVDDDGTPSETGGVGLA